jgi:hypothetical protein
LCCCKSVVVAELRSFAAKVPSSFQAWKEVQQQILINGGDYGNPEWSNPLVEEAVRRMGWRNLRMSEDQTADRARFLQCYEQVVEHATRQEMLLPHVAGYIESRREALTAGNEIKQLAEGMKK